MRLATVEQAGRAAVAVAVSEHEAVVLPSEFPDIDHILGTGGGDSTGGDWRARAAAALSGGPRVPVDQLAWLPPVRHPKKILCVALNNSANPDRIMSGPSTPAMFVKPSSALVGHKRPILLKKAYGRVHAEPELAVVIGRGGRDIPLTRAMEHVFGYTIINDITSPTMRAEDTFHYRAVHPDPERPSEIRYVESWVSYPARYKGADTFGPLGPWLVTADEIPDPHALRIRCSHNGHKVTDDSTANLRFSVAEVISFASGYLTLEPGDVIAMGTALKKAASGSAVQNVDLNALGGRVDVFIEGIGRLTNPVKWR